MIPFREALQQRALLFDGAMGTQLYARGVFINRCFDELNLSAPEIVEEVHRSYVRAQVDAIETNTFGANRYKLEPHGCTDRVAEINRAGARIARAASGGGVYIAGAIGPLGLRIEPWGPTSVDEAQEAFYEQAEALLEGGVDLFVLETFSDLSEILQAICAVKRLCDLPLIAQMTVGDDGHSLYGTPPEIIAARLQESGADIIGLNCSAGPSVIYEAVERMAKATSVPLAAQPNAGKPQEVEGRNLYLSSPEYMASYARRFLGAGVRLIGGCCGTTPEMIRAMRAEMKTAEPARISGSVQVQRSNLALAEAIPIERKSALSRALCAGEFATLIEILPPDGSDPGRAIGLAQRLKSAGVHAVNIPDGSRGKPRMSALLLAILLQQRAEIETLLHYSCRDRNLVGIQSDLLGAHAAGLRNILCVTGDPLRSRDYPDATAVFDVDSIGLTNIVQRLNRGLDVGGNPIEQPTAFHIGVAANQSSIDLPRELRRFRYKVEAGAEFAITQPVFDIKQLESFLREVEDVRIPVLAGIVPLPNLRTAEFLSNEAQGLAVPEEVLHRMRRATDEGRGTQEGLQIAQEIVERIRGLVQGIQISLPAEDFDHAVELLSELRG